MARNKVKAKRSKRYDVKKSNIRFIPEAPYTNPRLYQDVPVILPFKEGNSVDHPPHYNMSKYEVIDVLEEWFKERPLLWQAVKYIARCEFKDNKKEDLKKAIFYINRELGKLE